MKPIHSTPRSVLAVMQHVQQLIEEGTLHPGDRLPTERELAKQLNMSRGSARIGIGYLVGMGIVEVRSGVGTFLSDGAAHGSGPFLHLLGCLHHFSETQILEARSIVEEAAAALAVERREEHHVRKLAEELTELYASVHCVEEFRTHEMRFHRLVAQSSGNPVLVAAADMIAAVAFSTPLDTPVTPQQRRAAANRHHEIYRAIRMGRRVNPGRWMDSLHAPTGIESSRSPFSYESR